MNATTEIRTAIPSLRHVRRRDLTAAVVSHSTTVLPQVVATRQDAFRAWMSEVETAALAADPRAQRAVADALDEAARGEFIDIDEARATLGLPPRHVPGSNR